MKITNFTGTIYINKPKSELSDRMLQALEPANAVIENYKGCSVFEFNNDEDSFEIARQENDALKTLQNKVKHRHDEKIISERDGYENKILYVKESLDHYIKYDLWGYDYFDYD